MAITTVSFTRRLKPAVNYVFGKPHYDNKYIQGKRALETNSINAPVNPQDFKSATNATLKNNYQLKKNSVKGIRTIISFDPKQLSYKDLRDRHKAMAVGSRVAKRMFPHNQSLIVLQADNKNHILHDHIITCARRLDNGKSSTHNASFKRADIFTREAELHYGLKPLSEKVRHTPSRYISNRAVRGLQKRGKYSFMLALRHKIIKSYQNATTTGQFITNLGKNGVYIKSLDKLRKNKKTGKYEYHYYSHPTKSAVYERITPRLIKQKNKRDPKIAKNSNLKAHLGQYLRIQRHITYAFKDKKGIERVVRARKLGSDTDVSAILNTITRNQQSIQPKPKKYTLKDLHPTKKIYKQPKYILNNTGNNIHGYPEPILRNLGDKKEPVMKFHPKSHAVSKALNSFVSGLNKIKSATQKGTSQQKREIEMFETECQFKKEEAKKVAENEDARQAFLKVRSDNRAYNMLYNQELYLYQHALRQQIRNQAYFQGPSLF